ncbi:MAG: glycosyltransferase [Paracoccaceae bacterium]
MTGAVRTSLIIVSRHRPLSLRRCLFAVTQMDHADFEVIVVADPGGLAVAADFHVKAVPFDQPNISVARNLGIGASSGEVVAFIDDDAVPEPDWLSRLTAPFADPQVAAAGGAILSRNGISFEFDGGWVDRKLQQSRLAPADRTGGVFPTTADKALEIKGTNAAYRRARVCELGGFDPAISYYLDETELNLRLASRQALIAFVPQARVHHVKEQSSRRKENRAPLSLWDIGASTAITLRRLGADASALDEGWGRLLADETARITGLVRAGQLRRSEVAALLAGLADGFANARARSLPVLTPLEGVTAPFLRLESDQRPKVILSGRIWQSRRLKQDAARLVDEGNLVWLCLFSPTALYHRLRFTDQGYWLQTGGLFGKSDRTDPPFRLYSFSRRVSKESLRWQP